MGVIFCILVLVKYYICWINSAYFHVLTKSDVHHLWMTFYGRVLFSPPTNILHNPKQNTVRFMLDGENIDPESTPAALDLEDNDQIDCFLAQVGGGGGRIC